MSSSGQGRRPRQSVRGAGGSRSHEGVRRLLGGRDTSVEAVRGYIDDADFFTDPAARYLGL